MPVLRVLPPQTVNRIAAGEVIERPSAVVKELLENAVDASASRITIRVERAGTGLISVEDNGVGLSASDLSLAVMRHATSKLAAPDGTEPDLLRVRHMGFRGEALPSIGAVSRMTISSRQRGDDCAFALRLDAGRKSDPAPAAAPSGSGTIVEVRDLFFATPARLKFLKSERAENAAIADMVRRIAMAHAQVSIHLVDADGKRKLNFPAVDIQDSDAARLARLSDIMGRDFADNAIAIDAERDGVRISGYAGVPTLNQATARHQYMFVNNRPVRERMLIGLVRAAYQDLIAGNRHPLVALFIDLDPAQVDVNVHPAKTEVRFRESATVRGLCIGALRHGLASGGFRSATHLTGAALGAMSKNRHSSPVPRVHTAPATLPLQRPPPPQATGPVESAAEAFLSQQPPVVDALDTGGTPDQADDGSTTPEHLPLGVAQAQLHSSYIVAQTDDGMVIVDQHAAHERLVYEDMKKEMAAGGIRRQALLIPEIVDLGEEDANRVVEHSSQLLKMGIEIEPFGKGCIAVRATPTILGRIDAAALLGDVASEIATHGTDLSVDAKFSEIVGNIACRRAIKAGHRLSVEQMNFLLRQMERTPHSGQCNHGRPTWVALKLTDIEKLFERR